MRRSIVVRSVAVMLTIIVAIGLATWWWEGAGEQVDGNGHKSAIRVVAAAPNAAIRTPPLTAPSSASTPEAVDRSVPDLARLTVNERSDLLDQRPRNAAWAQQTEIALLARLGEAAGDIIPDEIRCADMICSVNGTVPSTSPADRERLVDQLVRGRLQTAYDRAGLKPAQALSIEADADGNLHFTEYLQRKR